MNIVATPLRAILAWLRAGYPEGVPREDYVSLFGVLHRRLTPLEVARVAETVGSSDGTGEHVRVDVAAEITRLAKESASADDIDRVCDHLAAQCRPRPEESTPDVPGT